MESVNVKLETEKEILLKQACYDGDYGVGNVDGSGDLYLINRTEMTACRIPDKYQKTEVTMYPPRGGFANGLLMVNVGVANKDKREKALYGNAGLWGWVDTSFNEVIKPEYIYAGNFVDGRAIVCKEKRYINKFGNETVEEAWGIIDINGYELIECRYDEINRIIGTSRYYLVHTGGWKNGAYCVADSYTGRIVLKIDFKISPESIFSDRYMIDEETIVFTERYRGVDYNYVYDFNSSRYLQYGEEVCCEESEETDLFSGFKAGSLIAVC